jgi:hypothetical protein
MVQNHRLLSASLARIFIVCLLLVFIENETIAQCYGYFPRNTTVTAFQNARWLPLHFSSNLWAWSMPGGLKFNGATHVIDMQNSAPGKYTIYYQMTNEKCPMDSIAVILLPPRTKQEIELLCDSIFIAPRIELIEKSGLIPITTQTIGLGMFSSKALFVDPHYGIVNTYSSNPGNFKVFFRTEDKVCIDSMEVILLPKEPKSSGGEKQESPKKEYDKNHFIISATQNFAPLIDSIKATRIEQQRKVSRVDVSSFSRELRATKKVIARIEKYPSSKLYQQLFSPTLPYSDMFAFVSRIKPGDGTINGIELRYLTDGIKHFRKITGRKKVELTEQELATLRTIEGCLAKIAKKHPIIGDLGYFKNRLDYSRSNRDSGPNDPSVDVTESEIGNSSAERPKNFLLTVVSKSGYRVHYAAEYWSNEALAKVPANQIFSDTTSPSWEYMEDLRWKIGLFKKGKLCSEIRVIDISTDSFHKILSTSPGVEGDLREFGGFDDTEVEDIAKIAGIHGYKEIYAEKLIFENVK